MKIFHITVDLIAQDDFSPGHVDWSKLTGVSGAKIQGYSQAPYVVTNQEVKPIGADSAAVGNIGG